MKIDDIRIEKSRVMVGSWALHIKSRGHEYTGYFDTLITFMDAVAGAIKYFGAAWGLTKTSPEGVTTSVTKR
jgi:hypothetical protein